MEKFKKIWGKIPHTTQMTLISTVVCTLLTASGASEDACEIARKLLTTSPQSVQVVGGVQ